jgi:hypothetical protein
LEGESIKYNNQFKQSSMSNTINYQEVNNKLKAHLYSKLVALFPTYTNTVVNFSSGDMVFKNDDLNNLVVEYDQKDGQENMYFVLAVDPKAKTLQVLSYNVNPNTLNKGSDDKVEWHYTMNRGFGVLLQSLEQDLLIDKINSL